jgi:hypothetical protein
MMSETWKRETGSEFETDASAKTFEIFSSEATRTFHLFVDIFYQP